MYTGFYPQKKTYRTQAVCLGYQSYGAWLREQSHRWT